LKILVTGVAGFIGSHLSRALLSLGHQVLGVDSLNDYYSPKLKEFRLSSLEGDSNFSFLKMDLSVKEETLKVFEDFSPEVVVNLAAQAGVRYSIEAPHSYTQNNIEAYLNVLEGCRHNGVSRLVYASSSSVYGGSKNTYFSEDENVDNPVSPYAASKKACELLAYTYHHLYKLNTTGLRFFTVYGPRGRPDMAPFKFIDKISRGLEMQQFGDGSSSRDYTYIDDIVDGIVRAIDRPYAYQVFNLGKGGGTSLKEFINIVEDNVGKKAIIKVLPDQPGDVPYTCADVSKAYDLLGYAATVPFNEGIRRTAEWYKNEYVKNVCIEPENQASGMGRAPSFAEIRNSAPTIEAQSKSNASFELRGVVRA